MTNNLEEEKNVISYSFQLESINNTYRNTFICAVPEFLIPDSIFCAAAKRFLRDMISELWGWGGSKRGPRRCTSPIRAQPGPLSTLINQPSDKQTRCGVWESLRPVHTKRADKMVIRKIVRR